MSTIGTVALSVVLAAAAFLRPWFNRPDDASSLASLRNDTVQFSYVAGLFQHDQQPVGPETGFRAKTLPQLGIIAREYESDKANSRKLPWERLNDYIQSLNSADPAIDRYKILFVARHGEGKSHSTLRQLLCHDFLTVLGVHNVKEREVGRQEWERYWSRIDGDGKVTWLDPELTPTGVQQALELGDFWSNAIHEDRVCSPTSFYTSPLRRCLQTTQLTWSKVPSYAQAKSTAVREPLRELFGVHTCDKRGPASKIRTDYPQFVIPPDFSEDDTLWTPEHRETLEEHSRLWQDFLHELFSTDGSTYVSLTTHSGATRALYLAIGHPDVWTAAGSVVPIVVRARRIDDV